jgi:hypothetical protein
MGNGHRLRKACRRKIRYASEPPANEHVRPYKCPSCNGWHMVSVTRRNFAIVQNDRQK